MACEEEHVVAALVSLCKEMGVKCVAQIGAEDGYEVNEIRKATGCRAIAIEGDSHCKPCSPDIEWYERLIGATDCVTDFYQHDSLGLSSQIKRGDDAKEHLTRLGQERLDTFCAARGISPRPDALIIDTEGTTLDVLEGCGDLIKGVKLVYAEVQAYAIRDGIRPVGDIDALLLPLGFTHHRELPSYDGGAQSNLTWIRL